jgi:D-alanyl-D-alanine carboxypeptidase.
MGLRHEERLNGVREELCRVIRRAAELTEFDITVAEGLRSKGRQQQMFEQGKSKTLNSKHLTGEAVDIYPLTDDHKAIAWGNFPAMISAVKQAAYEFGISIECGADWKMRDCPHVQLCKVVTNLAKDE